MTLRVRWLVAALLLAAVTACDAARHRPERFGTGTSAAAGMGGSSHFPARAPPIEINPTDGDVDGVVIFLHGLGGSPEKETWLANDPSKRYARPGIKWIFPWSPELDVTVTKQREPAWYDINDFNIGSLVDYRSHILAAARYIESIVDAQVNELGIDPRRVVVGGFSQGGAIALTASLRYPKRLGGILALSTYLPLRDEYPEEMNSRQRWTPLFQAHGKDDRVLRMEYYFATRAKLSKLGFKNRWDYLYPGLGHDKCWEETLDMYAFLDDVFGDKCDDLDEGNWVGGPVDLGLVGTKNETKNETKKETKKETKEETKAAKARGKEAELPVVQRGGARNDPKQQVQRRLRDMVFRANALLGREQEALEAAERPRPSFY